MDGDVMWSDRISHTELSIIRRTVSGPVYLLANVMISQHRWIILTSFGSFVLRHVPLWIIKMFRSDWKFSGHKLHPALLAVYGGWWIRTNLIYLAVSLLHHAEWCQGGSLVASVCHFESHSFINHNTWTLLDFIDLWDEEMSEFHQIWKAWFISHVFIFIFTPLPVDSNPK